MKHYMDIQNLREFSDSIGDIPVPANTSCFQVGDTIQITEKYDGANASIENINGSIQSFSRRGPLNFKENLNGFYQYIQKKAEAGLTIPEGIVVFGEWSGAHNRILYEKKGLWLVFDIYERNGEYYWPQEQVKAFCTERGLDYIHELYNGPFISWDHCRSFSDMPFYGDRQEGIVVKNQSKLRNATDYFYLKLVNESFKEKRNRVRVVDPEKQDEIQNARTLMESIVTQARIEKMIFKLRDEGILGDTLRPEDMKTISQHLPRRIYEDCSKEEPETVAAAGAYAGKSCASLTMEIARKLICKQ